MGCLQSSRSRQGSIQGDGNSEQPQYSWDKRKKLDPKDYMIDGLKGETAGRTPGTINGQQFIIQNCEDCSIYIFDHMATVSIDDCTNCRIFIGPVASSIFIRDCKECKIMVACQQFRTRDCKRLDVFLCCTTQPIIESTTSIKFGCFQCSYPQLEEQFRAAKLSEYNNNWSNIHDFTPVPGENNFSLLPEEAKPEDLIGKPSIEPLSSVELSFEPDKSLVPRTLGSRRKPISESCLIIFFYDGGSHDRAKHFRDEMKQHHSNCVLVQSKEVTMQPSDAQRVFGSDKYAMAVSGGAVIGFEYCGENVCQHAQENVVAITQGTTGLVYVSSTTDVAAQQIENFYNFADMQMSV